MEKIPSLIFTVISWTMVILFVRRSFRSRIAESNRDNRLIALGLGVVCTLWNCIVAIGERRFGMDQWVAFVYFMAPAMIATAFPPKSEHPKRNLLVDLLLICWFWIPNDFGLHYMFRAWGGGMFGYALTAFVGMIYMLVLFPTWRDVDLALDWKFCKKDLVWIAGGYLALAALIIPIAIKVEFIHVGLIKNPAKAPVALFIWFAPALCEELIFRGVIQRVMIGWFRPVAGIALASVIFGFAHIDNSAGIYACPNWWYVLFAGIAGGAYGIVAYKRNLQSSATLHFLVDFTWVILFRGGK